MANSEDRVDSASLWQVVRTLWLKPSSDAGTLVGGGRMYSITLLLAEHDPEHVVKQQLMELLLSSVEKIDRFDLMISMDLEVTDALQGLRWLTPHVTNPQLLERFLAVHIRRGCVRDVEALARQLGHTLTEDEVFQTVETAIDRSQSNFQDVVNFAERYLHGADLQKVRDLVSRRQYDLSLCE